MRSPASPHPPAFVPLTDHVCRSDEEIAERARSFADETTTRRTIRHFADRPVPRGIIEDCLRAAGSAPSGANRQPWQFVVVSDAELKREIREAAEEEERAFYGGRAPDDWLAALEPIGTDAHKPFLDSAPYLIAIFAESYDHDGRGQRRKSYYVMESVGIATGLLITALHHAGLASLTHTPSPMKFLNEILGRPSNERPFLLLVVGHPADDVEVPDITRKPLSKIATFL